MEHYEKRKTLLLKTDSQETTDYLDKLLWEFPKDSFLPHSTSFSSSAYIYLSSADFIPASIYSIFNFTKQPLLSTGSITKIYELEDSSSPERKKNFENKYKLYSESGYHLISL